MVPASKSTFTVRCPWHLKVSVIRADADEIGTKSAKAIEMNFMCDLRLFHLRFRNMTSDDIAAFLSKGAGGNSSYGRRPSDAAQTGDKGKEDD